MYLLGKHNGRRHLPLIVAVVVLGAVVAVVGLLRTLKSDTTIKQSPPVIRQVSSDQAAAQHITKSIFMLDLPAGWVSTPAPPTTDNGFSWRGTKGSEAEIRLDVYIDRLPQSFAENRLLPVQAAGDHMDIIGTVSENCSDFTDKTAESQRTGMASAKWDGVSFICDMGNYERDVIATGSTEGLNTITLTGTKSGSHQVLIVCTDNNINPDFSTLTNIVRSFRVQ